VKLDYRAVSTKSKEAEYFRFIVNGLPTFAKGANYVPAHYFVPSGSRDIRTYEILLQSAVDANFNMLRVWGGGHYELDTFYDFADSMGLMLWHDFMFGNTLYPPT
jgi:beta-mannosidase